MLSRLIQQWRSVRYYVIADPSDNSITLSERLFKHIKGNAEAGDSAQVFVFLIPNENTYGFMVNPQIEQPTQLCSIQYNDKYRCIGFETLCPSVGRMFYEYGLPHEGRVKLSVSIRDTNGMTYYQIDRPNEKHIRKRKQKG